MAYIGRDTDKISNVEVLDNITFDGSSSYTLQKGGSNFTPSSANTLLLSIDGVVQAGNFTVSGSTIDFGTAVAGTSTCDFVLHYGVGLITAPSDGTVTTAKLADDAVTEAKIADGAVENEHLNANIISGQTELATTPADTDEFLISDAGVLKRMDYSHIKASSDYVNLTSATVSGSPGSVSIDGFFTSDYDIYVLKIYNFRQSAQTTPFYRFNVSGTANSTASNYYTITGNWYGQSGTSNQTNDKYWGNEDKVRLFNWDISDNGNEVSAWETIIHNPLTAGDHNLVETRGVVNAQNLNTLSVFHAATQFRTGNAISGITVYAGASSNISELKYSLYGLKK